MTLTLTLPSDLEHRLTREAESRGLAVDEYALALLYESLALLEPETIEDERLYWQRLAERSLGYAYSDEEPDYSLDMIKEPNPAYEGG